MTMPCVSASARARVITAAALIMVTVFAGFILHPDPIIKQFGVGLSVAILLDATIVRLVIVPAPWCFSASGTGTCRGGCNGCRVATCRRRTPIRWRRHGGGHRRWWPSC
ncbi:MAG TPA: MMPL family transporter [Thermoleophilia bacterium]|nr:MMPL family transporter [Thermoleophilia bacterium]